MVVTAVIMYIIAAGSLVLGTMQLLHKGKPINNAYLYADDVERRTTDWKPYYRQSGIVFLVIGLQFMMPEFLLLGTVVIYAVVSAILIEKNKKKENTAGNEK